MPLEQLANIAEVFGMLIVGITLIFLTVQMRHNARATRSATAADSISMIAGWYGELGNSEQSSALFYNALVDPDAQTPEKWAQFVYLLHGLLLAVRNSHYLAGEGMHEDRIAQSIADSIVAVKDLPGFLLFWRLRKGMFFPEFQDYVEAIMSSDRRVSEGMHKDINPA